MYMTLYVVLECILHVHSHHTSYVADTDMHIKQYFLVGESESEVLEKALHRLRDRVQQRRVLTKPCFQDFDKCCTHNTNYASYKCALTKCKYTILDKKCCHIYHALMQAPQWICDSQSVSTVPLIPRAHCY